jgi:prolyl 4-hydroxylase
MGTTPHGADAHGSDGLHERARRGESAAQVELAESLAAAGRGREAAEWLSTAAESRDAYANALLGAWQIFGHNVEPDRDSGLQRVQFAATHGESIASALLADLHAAGIAVAHDWRSSLDWLTAAARQGNARALTQVALLQAGEETDPLRLTLLWAAATRALPVAQALLGNLLIATENAQQVQAGRGWLHLARNAGSPLVRGAPAGGDVGIRLDGPSAIASLPWKLIRERLDLSRFLAKRPNPATTSADPWMRTYPRLIPPMFCDYLVGLSAPHLRRAAVNDIEHGERQLHDMRTNSDFTFAAGNCDVLLRLVEHRIALAAELPHDHQEASVVLHYRPGETYEDHYDFIDPQIAAFHADLDARGQRTATALIYLNEDYDAGETHFPLLLRRFRGSKGEALVWRNVRPDGEPERRTLHAGLPPSRGEKWVLSKWIRSRPQRREQSLEALLP